MMTNNPYYKVIVDAAKECGLNKSELFITTVCSVNPHDERIDQIRRDILSGVMPSEIGCVPVDEDSYDFILCRQIFDRNKDGDALVYALVEIDSPSEPYLNDRVVQKARFVSNIQFLPKNKWTLIR